MTSRAKNDNLLKYRKELQKRNEELILRAIKHIETLNGIINFSTVSQVTFDIAEPLKKEKGMSLAGISKNKLYRSIIEKAKLSQNIEVNLKTNRNFYSNESNKNITIADIKLQLHELRVKNANLKMENKIISEQLKSINLTSNVVNTVDEDLVKKYKYFSQTCSNLINRILELDIAYIDLDNTTLNLQIFDDVILQKDAFELLYKDKLNELRNEN